MDKKFTIFISSTYEDLKDERDAVVKAVLEMGHIPVGMEMFSAADDAQWELIKRNIDTSDYYIVIVAHRYGSMDGSVSYTEKEYDYAAGLGVPILGFVIDPNATWPPAMIEKARDAELTAFKDKVREKTVSFWSNKDDLAGKASRALGKQIPISPRPGWIRGTDVAGPEALVEMSRLSRENADLRRELETLAPATVKWQIVFASAYDSSGGLGTATGLKVVLFAEAIGRLPVVIPRHQFRLSLRDWGNTVESQGPLQGEFDIRSLVAISAGEITINGSGTFALTAALARPWVSELQIAEAVVKVTTSGETVQLVASLQPSASGELTFAERDFDYSNWSTIVRRSARAAAGGDPARRKS